MLDEETLTLYKNRSDIQKGFWKQFQLTTVSALISGDDKSGTTSTKLSAFDFMVQTDASTSITLRASNIEERRSWTTSIKNLINASALVATESRSPSGGSAGRIELINNETLKIEELYKIDKKLGSGVAGEVHRATNRSTGERVAIKTLSKTKFLTTARSKTTTKREIDIMQQISCLDEPCDNIVDLFAVIETSSNIHIVMELVEGGELFDRVIDKGVYTEDEAMQVMQSLTTAVSCLHQNGVVHRDIKPENILLSKNSDTFIKLTDFGLSNTMAAGAALKSKCGTPVYMAPEMLQAHPYGTGVDVWSCGIILYIILSGTLPFYADNPEEFLELVLESNYDFPDDEWGELSSSVKDLISKILVPDPDHRVTLQGVLDHPWMKGRR